MMKRVAVLGVCAALVLAPCIDSAQATKTEQQKNADSWNEATMARVVKTVRSKLLSLTDYGVFDYLSFGIRGRTIILNGYASRPILKSDAGNVVKRIQGVESVENHIKVLPNSPMDDHIRRQVYSRIYSQSSLRKYTGSPVGFGRQPSVARAAGGITQDPPRGYHAIHIIVNNGNVILEGVVDSPMDAQIADITANSTPGVFSVTDNLHVAAEPNKLK